jgi:serine protease Do
MSVARPARPRVGLAAALLLVALAAAPPGDPAEGAPRWGWLGVRIRDLSEQEMLEISERHGIMEGFGAVIVEVLDSTPAEASGLRAGDIVVGFRGLPVVDTRVLQRYVAAAAVGESVTLTVLRRQEGRRRLNVRPAVMPEAVAADRVAAEYGFLVRPPEGEGEMPTGARPPAVSVVLPGSRAAAAGLRAGDVLLEVNGRPVLSVEAVRAALLSVALDRPLPLLVRRGAEPLAVRILSPAVPDE